MNVQLTDRTVRSLCGESAYRKGEAYRRSGNVSLSLREAGDDRWTYDAAVKDNGICRVRVAVGIQGEVSAECDCSVGFAFEKYCKHVAGALLQIVALQRPGEPIDAPARPGKQADDAARFGEQGDDAAQSGSGEQADAPALRPPFADARIAAASGMRGASAAARPREAGQDARLANRLLELFQLEPRAAGGGARGRFDMRETLSAEFLVMPYASGSRKHLLGIELRIGPDKRYVVQDIRAFLAKYERGETHACSRHFAYDPSRHCFAAPDDAVLARLVDIRRDEKLHREAAGALYTGEIDDPRTLPIPPSGWEALAPKLAEAPIAKLRHGERTVDGVRPADEPLPLRFEFDQAEDDTVVLDVHGLEDVLVLEAYGLALSEGRFAKLGPGEAKRLLEMQRILQHAEVARIRIPPRQAEPFMERVVPGFRKLGDVRIARAVADRIVHSPLRARVYLDRVRDRLLIGVEFQYGDIVVDPFADEARRGKGRILLREGEREARILELIESTAAAKTEGGYFLQDEESEYEFLAHIVPELEKLATVYATSAVKARLFVGHAPPNIEVDLDERTNWLEFRFRLDGISDEDIRLAIRSLSEKRKYHRLPNGALLPLETEAFREMIRFLNEVALPKGDIVGPRFRLPVASGLHLLRDEGRDGGDVVRLGKSIRRLLERLRHPDHLDVPVPETLAPVLRDYQQYGYQWMKTLAHYRFGGILADDMGLGKTVQTIAYLVSVLPDIRARKRPALIVAPASLMYNWRNELRKFAPELRAIVADGTKSERDAALKAGEDVDAIIVSYPLLRRDVARYAERSFHTLILDEAQAFKNFATQTARAVKALRAEQKFALTGTPIENALDELWSIFDCVFPGLFPNRKKFGELPRETIARRARPFLLRRLKRDVLRELPEKIESIQPSELLPEQKKLYAACLAQLRADTLKHLDEGDLRQTRIRILAGLTRLRQIICHPALFVEDYAGGSAKLEQLLETIEDGRRAGRRLLVFSQFTEMLGLIGRKLAEQGVPYFYLDGNTPAAERVELCARFNEGERDLFLVSLKAGGTGLNLTGADTVVLYDLWWNPAVEQQAEDRAHRIGQKKVVHVIRLVAQGTVEEKMYELQRKKKSLIEEVIRPGEEALSAFTEEDIRELLALE